ncbi:hypothetical protein BGZ70_009986, partial [Mortierella alpina]
IQCAMVTNDSRTDIEAAAAPDEAAVGLEEGAQNVRSLVHAFILAQTTFDGSSFRTYLKNYCRSLKGVLEAKEYEEIHGNAIR